MSMYVSKEDLLKDKIKYLEEENQRLLQRLHLSKRDQRANRDRLRHLVNFYHEERDFYYELWSELFDVCSPDLPY